MPLKIHWTFPVETHWKVTIPWNIYCWQVKIRWKMSLIIHDDFGGVDFWCAIFCPHPNHPLTNRPLALPRGTPPSPASLRVLLRRSCVAAAGPKCARAAAWLPGCLAARLPACLPAYLPTCILKVSYWNYSSIYSYLSRHTAYLLPAYLPTCLPACLPTWVVAYLSSIMAMPGWSYDACWSLAVAELHLQVDCELTVTSCMSSEMQTSWPAWLSGVAARRLCGRSARACEKGRVVVIPFFKVLQFDVLAIFWRPFWWNSVEILAERAKTRNPQQTHNSAFPHVFRRAAVRLCGCAARRPGGWAARRFPSHAWIPIWNKLTFY